jgi:acetate kinase
MTEQVLVINAGSSSLKYSLVDAKSGEAAATGLVEKIGEEQSHHVHHGPDGEFNDDRAVADHEAALEVAVRAFETHGPALGEVDIVAVGHRVVHGGDRFAAPALVDDELIAAVTDLVPLAPLHNPANLEGIEVARRLLPHLPPTRTRCRAPGWTSTASGGTGSTARRTRSCPGRPPRCSGASSRT